MTDDEFELFLNACQEELEHKQKRLQLEHGLGAHPRWDYDANTGILTFTGIEGVPPITAQTVQIGSYAPDSQTWLWAWANDTVPASERTKSAALQALADVTGLDAFRAEGMEVDQEMADQLTAMSVHHLKALGSYRAPLGSLQVILALTQIDQEALRL